MDSTAPEVSYETYLCKSNVDANAVFGCNDGAEQYKFKYLYEVQLTESNEQYESPGRVHQELEGLEEHQNRDNAGLAIVEFYDVARTGSKAVYGRHPYTGEVTIDGKTYRKYDMQETTQSVDGGFEFYQSATQFFTTSPNGIVTTNRNAQNANIIDTDGRVYPVAINTPEGTYPFYVTFAQIGQFNESGALGRIMGGGDGKAGTMSGEAYDQQVCYYQVCRIDDPTCFGQYCVYNGEKISLDACIASGKSYEDCSKEYCPATNACVDITRSEVCNKGQITSSHDFSDAKFHACLEALKEANCCNEFQAYISLRQDGLYSGSVPEDLAPWYGKECDKKELCESFTIISQETYFASSSLLTDNSFINNNGALQLNARTVSNYNVFPNGATGINWQTPEAQAVIQHIESIGDGIFSNAPDYKITLNNQCANAIRDYNARQAGGKDGNGIGGFNDYTNDVITNNEGQITDDLDEKKYGSQVKMSDEFYELLKKNCGFTGTKANGDYPEKVNDRSRVLS
jgi:hypothetical protein